MTEDRDATPWPFDFGVRPPADRWEFPCAFFIGSPKEGDAICRRCAWDFGAHQGRRRDKGDGT